jgi:hypothetical protein
MSFGEVNSASDLARAQLAVLTGMGRGELSPEEAEAAARALEAGGVALVRLDFEKRIAALEQKAALLDETGVNEE